MPTPQPWPAANHIARGNYLEPAVAIDASGAVHIAATGADWEGIWYFTNASGSWVNQLVAVPPLPPGPEEPNGLYDEPAIAIDPNDGSVWIAFIYWQCGDCAPGWSNGVYIINNAAGPWSDPVPLGSDEGATYPSLAVRDGHVFLAWAVAGDYIHRYGPIGFGTDAAGVWQIQQIAGAGFLPHLSLNADGRAAILFGGGAMRYAYQRPNGSFVIERLPGPAAVVRSTWYSMLAVDPVSGNAWAAWDVPGDEQGQRAVFLATRTADGWSDPITALSDGDLIGFGVRDRVVQLTADKSGLTYASNASGEFVEQIIYARDTIWAVSALALLPNGRPIVVLARDEPDPSKSGMWLYIGPAV